MPDKKKRSKRTKMPPNKRLKTEEEEKPEEEKPVEKSEEKSEEKPKEPEEAKAAAPPPKKDEKEDEPEAKAKPEAEQKKPPAKRKAAAAAAAVKKDDDEETKTTAAAASSPAKKKYKPGEQWQTKFELLKAYKEEKGDCLVPARYKENGLGSWVDQQRTFYRWFQEQKKEHPGITKERIDKLESIGFVWKVRVKGPKYGKTGKKNGGGASSSSKPASTGPKKPMGWNVKFAALQAYKEKHGNCCVPLKHKEDGLGAWVGGQRKAYRAFQAKAEHPGISQERIDKLNEIGFIWNMNGIGPVGDTSRQPRDKWLAQLEMLKAYKAQHGDCLVPKRYIKDGVQLGQWVYNQRRAALAFKAKKKNPKITQERIDILDAIDFAWSVRPKDAWNIKFEALKAFKAQHGNCLVHHNYKTEPEGLRLGVWVAHQRTFYGAFMAKAKNPKITQERIDLLNAVGFVWSLGGNGGPRGPRKAKTTDATAATANAAAATSDAAAAAVPTSAESAAAAVTAEAAAAVAAATATAAAMAAMATTAPATAPVTTTATAIGVPVVAAAAAVEAPVVAEEEAAAATEKAAEAQTADV